MTTASNTNSRKKWVIVSLGVFALLLAVFVPAKSYLSATQETEKSYNSMTASVRGYSNFYANIIYLAKNDKDYKKGEEFNNLIRTRIECQNQILPYEKYLGQQQNTMLDSCISKLHTAFEQMLKQWKVKAAQKDQVQEVEKQLGLWNARVSEDCKVLQAKANVQKEKSGILFNNLISKKQNLRPFPSEALQCR